MTLAPTRHPGSFRDPAGFVFFDGARVFRQVAAASVSEFEAYEASGLKAELEDGGLILSCRRSDHPPLQPETGAVVLEADTVAHWSFPYEWCFAQLKDAALLTLAIAARALRRGLVLRDASAYNVQFRGCQPVFIDLLSFEEYKEGEPWVAYRQFCRHFLAPLALMAWVDVRLGRLLPTNLDGIPLDLAAKLLPAAAKLRPGLAAHLVAHARSETLHARAAEVLKPAHPPRAKPVSKTGSLALLDSLKSTIEGLAWNGEGTEWGDYYRNTSYSAEAMASKMRLVDEFTTQAKGVATAWDMGANDGTFSRILSSRGIATVAWDIDPAAVQHGYLEGRNNKAAPLNLMLDLTNPTPAIGWELSERESFLDRGPVDLVLALALVHHLVISNNTPLNRVAALFARMGRVVVIEWVPKDDPQVQRLLSSRRDIFQGYDVGNFKSAFLRYFDMLREEPVPGTPRSLFLFERR